MSRAVKFHEPGAPTVLRYEQILVPPPGADEVHVRLKAVGVNYLDTLFRRGLLPAALPSGLGHEGAGDVLAVGERVTNLRIGDRVAFGTSGLGAYAEVFNVAAQRVARLPEELSYETGAAIMMKGLTAQYLVRQVVPIGPGTTILFHAAAGGVGSIACQWARSLGATVIGTVGAPEKREFALAHGCDHVIEYRREDLAARVREITNGEGVAVVYDSVGKDVFEGSLDCLARFGSYISFGAASGAAPPFTFDLLGAKGCIRATKTSVWQYTATAAQHDAAARDLLDTVRTGRLRIDVAHRFPLADAPTAHSMLESRRTMGPIVLQP